MTPKQKAFVAAYAGNGPEAAEAAGYKGSRATLRQVAYELMQRPEVREAIAERQTTRIERLIASREEVEERLTAVVRGEDVELALKAISLLSKMRGWQQTKVLLEGKMTLEQLITQAEVRNGARSVAVVDAHGGRPEGVSGVAVEAKLSAPPDRGWGGGDEGGG